MQPFLLVALLACASLASACTTLAVGKGASADGSVFAAHSADGGGNTDPRLVRIPGNVYAEGAKRAVFASPESYPRYVGVDPRSPAGSIPEYLQENCMGNKTTMCAEYEPIGFIPQVNKTYSYYEAVYGVMNEHQVGISESTCSAVYSSTPLPGGKAMLSINALSQIAMERASTAKEAVQIMGDLSQKYGFYGASASFEGGAESLIVTDPNEAWVFHVLADSSASSSIWVGARVPDDHVAVVANMFSVRTVDLDDSDNFLGRTDMWEIAKADGLWDESLPRDWTATFSDGEYAHKYYSGRRMWGVFRLLAPETSLPAEYGNLKTDKPYPFTVPVSVAGGVKPADMFNVLRDYYEGTPYTLSQPKLGGGPFGSIDRYGGQESGDDVAVSGNWERSIAMYRTAESYVVQSKTVQSGSGENKKLGGTVWFGAQSASYTVYVPQLSGGILNVPACLSAGWQGDYDLSTNFWAARSLANLVQIKWKYMMPFVRDMQQQLEAESVDVIADIRTKLCLKAAAQLIEINSKIAVQNSMKLFHGLMFRFADGFVNTWTDTNTFANGSPGYPGYWLESVDYENGPPPVGGKSKFNNNRKFPHAL